MRITTNECGQFGHPEFVLEVDEAQVPSTYLTDVAQTIEGLVASGSIFRPGQQFQIGWGMTLVEASGEMLSLTEPDMASFPIKWTKGITNTLRQMMLQLFMLDSVALRQEMDAPTILQSLVACNRYREPNFFMSRSQGSGDSDSGWFIGCLNEAHDHQDAANLRCISIYEAFLNQRARSLRFVPGRLSDRNGPGQRHKSIPGGRRTRHRSWQLPRRVVQEAEIVMCSRRTNPRGRRPITKVPPDCSTFARCLSCNWATPRRHCYPAPKCH